MGNKFNELGFESELQTNHYDENPRPALSQTGKILLALTGSAAIGLTIVCVPFVSPAFRKVCVPYVPATDPQIRNVFAALRHCPKTTLVDLGSGDGRIVLEAAKLGYAACGIELNPFLVLYSRVKAFTSGLSGRARFKCRDLWKCPLARYESVVVFGVPQMMDKLERKFVEECTADCRLVACRFPLPNLTAAKVVGVGIDTVWLYHVPKPASAAITANI